MAILQLNSFHKLIKDIFIMAFILLAIQLISRIFKVELIFLLKSHLIKQDIDIIVVDYTSTLYL